jgi:integrase
MLYKPTYRDKTTGEKRQSDVWWYDFRFSGTRIRESSGLTSKTAAREAENKRREDLRTGAAGIRRTKAKMFRSAAEEYLTLKEPSLAESSLRIEKTSVDRLLPVFGGRLVSDIEARDIAKYQQERTKEGAAGGTVNLEIGTLRAILRRNGQWARVQPDVRLLPEKDDVGKALDAEEEARLLKACSESRSRSLYPAIVLALNTGLRSSELTSLRWSQIDFEKRFLTVGKSKTEAGKGRRIPLNETALATLRFWAANFPDRKPEHHVFPSEKYGEGGAVYSSDPERPVGRLKVAWEAAKRRTADPENGIPAVVCRWHDLRHTFLTRLLENGTAFPMLSAIMGWSPATTARMAKRYGHVSVEAMRTAVDALEGRVIVPDPPKYSPKSQDRTKLTLAK